VIGQIFSSLVSTRFICGLNTLLWIYALYDLAYIRMELSAYIPFSLLLIFAISGNGVAFYLAEYANKKIEIYIGCFGLYMFLVIAIGGVFFGW